MSEGVRRTLLCNVTSTYMYKVSLFCTAGRKLYALGFRHITNVSCDQNKLVY